MPKPPQARMYNANNPSLFPWNAMGSACRFGCITIAVIPFDTYAEAICNDDLRIKALQYVRCTAQSFTSAYLRIHGTPLLDTSYSLKPHPPTARKSAICKETDSRRNLLISVPMANQNKHVPKCIENNSMHMKAFQKHLISF